MWGTARERNLQLMYDAHGGDAPGSTEIPGVW